MVDLLRIYYGEGERGLIYVEKQTYQNKDLAILIAVNPNSSHLKRDIGNKLDNMGFDKNGYSFPKRGQTAITWVPQSAEEKIPYLCGLLGIDSRVDSFNFAIFVYCLLEEDDFDCRPWSERSQWLKEVYDIEVSESTLKRWTYKLIKEDTLIKDKNNFSWWSSSSIDGQVIRTELDDQDQDLERYKEFNREFWSNQKVQSMDKKELGKSWFSAVWSKFGCKFYKCYSFTFGAWHGELLEELVNVTKLYLEENKDEG